MRFGRRNKSFTINWNASYLTHVLETYVFKNAVLHMLQHVRKMEVERIVKPTSSNL